MTRPVKRDSIQLAECRVMGAGTERTCFLHPFDSGKCIKVARSRAGRQHRREWSYFEALSRRGVPWRHLPAYHGAVDTDQGTGLVFSLVRDFDGNISTSLKAFADAHGIGRIRPALEELEAFFSHWRIITCDMNLNNFLVQRPDPETLVLVMIDGLGNREFIPVSSLFAFAYRSKMKRRWRRMENKLNRLYGAPNHVAPPIIPLPAG